MEVGTLLPLCELLDLFLVMPFALVLASTFATVCKATTVPPQLGPDIDVLVL